MIYPRLRLARHLLSNDGAIFISIDENELANLKRVCDEVFDGHNHACTFVVKSNPRGSQSNVFCSSVHEYILCYVKDADCQTGFGVRLSQEMVSEYNLVDERGAYRLVGLRLRGGAWRRSDRPLLFYPLYVDETSGFICLERPKNPHSQVLPIQPTTGEEGTWRWGKEKVAASHAELIAKKVLRNNQEVWDIFQKDYLNTSNGNKKLTKPKTILDEKEVNYQNGTNEIKELFGKAVFSFPKPVYLIEKLIEMTPSKDGIVMDFFCGSATSADAVMSFNSKHGSNFQFFMVQVPQTCEPGSVAQKAGYATIAEIAKERIRRAGTKLKEKTGDHDQNIDIGFRVLKVDTSNMRDVYYKPDAIKKEDLFDHVENIKQDRTPEDLLFQVLLDWGVDLSLPIAQENIDGKTVFFVDGNALAACFDTGITEDLVKKIATRKPLRVVFRDAGFSDDSVKINVEQIFKLLSPDTEVKAI
jgi:adenine-specific DNA-methyltransferase